MVNWLRKMGKTISGAWVKPVQAIIFLAMLACGFYFFSNRQYECIRAMTALALHLRLVWIAPVGGGDMPVVVSAIELILAKQQGIGFTLENNMLIVAGSPVGFFRCDSVLHHVKP